MLTWDWIDRMRELGWDEDADELEGVLHRMDIHHGAYPGMYPLPFAPSRSKVPPPVDPGARGDRINPGWESLQSLPSGAVGASHS
jgi:hypothetical protein